MLAYARGNLTGPWRLIMKLRRCPPGYIRPFCHIMLFAWTDDSLKVVSRIQNPQLQSQVYKSEPYESLRKDDTASIFRQCNKYSTFKSYCFPIYRHGNRSIARLIINQASGKISLETFLAPKDIKMDKKRRRIRGYLRYFGENSSFSVDETS